MKLVPVNGCVLVKLTENYQYVSTPDKKYDTKTSGIVVRQADDVTNIIDLTGKKVFFEEYKDGTSFDVDGDKHAFIKHEDIRGYEDA